MEIKKINNYYQLKIEKGCYVFYEPISKRIKITTLESLKGLPREIKEKILHRTIVGSIKERYIYEKIIEEFESNLHYYEIFESS